MMMTMTETQAEIADIAKTIINEYKKASADPVYFAEKYLNLRITRFQARALTKYAAGNGLALCGARANGKSTMLYILMAWSLTFDIKGDILYIADKYFHSGHAKQIVMDYVNMVPDWLGKSVIVKQNALCSPSLQIKFVAEHTITNPDSLRGHRSSFAHIFVDNAAYFKQLNMLKSNLMMIQPNSKYNFVMASDHGFPHATSAICFEEISSIYATNANQERVILNE